MKRKKKVLPKKTAKPFRTWWIQGWGTYTAETLVCVGGYSHKQILGIMKGIKAKPKLIEAWEKDGKEMQEKWLAGENHGVLWNKHASTMLWIKSWDNTWDNFDTLIHEISHMVDIVLRDSKKMHDETEACAYQSEFLFREIRRKLVSRMNRRDKKKRNY